MLARKSLIAASAFLLFAAVLPAPAQADDLLTFTLVVPCNDVDGVSSTDVIAATLPPGQYAYSIIGACEYGPAPPGTSCYISLHTVIFNPCGTTPIQTGCWGFNIEINDQCVAPDAVGFLVHAGGAITARFVEAGASYYANNEGAFAVTLTYSDPRSIPSFTLAVDCSEVDGASSDDLAPLGMPAGQYAYNIVGSCFYGPQPCYISVHTYIINGCATEPIETGCWGFNVWINGQCVGSAPAGTIAHPGGAVTAKFEEAAAVYYGDNEGVFLVTFTFTP